MNIQAETIDEYFSQTGNREADLRQLDQLIRVAAPHLKRELFKNMGNGVAIGFGMMPYHSSSMKTPGTWPLLGLANQKHYMALYVCAVIDGQYVAERHKDKLGNVDIGRSCIRFKKLSDVNLDFLASMLQELDVRYQRGEKLFG